MLGAQAPWSDGCIVQEKSSNFGNTRDEFLAALRQDWEPGLAGLGFVLKEFEPPVKALELEPA
jgi:hypothetical protein